MRLHFTWTRVFGVSLSEVPVLPALANSPTCQKQAFAVVRHNPVHTGHSVAKERHAVDTNAVSHLDTIHKIPDYREDSLLLAALSCHSTSPEHLEVRVDVRAAQHGALNEQSAADRVETLREDKCRVRGSHTVRCRGEPADGAICAQQTDTLALAVWNFDCPQLSTLEHSVAATQGAGS